jgi:hypothetical protein
VGANLSTCDRRSAGILNQAVHFPALREGAYGQAE